MMPLSNERPEKEDKGVKPLSPKEVADKKDMTIPKTMIKAVNNLIVRTWNGYSSNFKLKELVEEYSKLSGKKPSQIYGDKSLDIEHLFRKAGWSVKYESPSYGDSDFDAYFEFTKKKE